ncbi:hypothetical protein Zmor_026811 [Zophobas morio]|uniref:Homeobox domain-containing protein n=1 Tax=Zophobas morio TaxID=2755281 RepID=A0AA38M5U7_9CUCU|nr:hypothetical protein Zmor_026811 [Zophobas morio]
MRPCKARKQRTSFSFQTLEKLNAYFEKDQFPSGYEFSRIADELHLEKRVVRIWFCNKRQALRKSKQ